MRHLLNILLLIAVFGNSQGQQKLTKTQGSQAGDNVHCSLQDRSGNLWFGTTGEGLYKYDGKTFSQFTAKDGLKSNMINHILEAKDGKIWICTAAGATYYDGKSFTEFKIASQNYAAHEKHDVFSVIQDKRGNLWFATINGVYIYDGKSFMRFAVNDSVSGFMSKTNNVEYILEDAQGNMWFGGRMNAGAFRYDGKSITNLKLDGDNWVWPVLQDKNGNIWFSNWKGAYRYDGKSFTHFTQKDGLGNAIVTRVIEDKKGNLWFGCEGEKGGVCRYDGKAFTCFTTNDGLPNNSVWSVLEDKSGNVWVGTRNTGLSRYDGKGFTTFSE